MHGRYLRRHFSSIEYTIQMGRRVARGQRRYANLNNTQL